MQYLTLGKKLLQWGYKININIIEREVCIKDLSIYFYHKLDFTTHINNKSRKALKMVGFLIRTSKF